MYNLTQSTGLQLANIDTSRQKLQKCLFVVESNSQRVRLKYATGFELTFSHRSIKEALKVDLGLRKPLTTKFHK